MEQASVKIHSWCPSQGQVKSSFVTLHWNTSQSWHLMHSNVDTSEDPLKTCNASLKRPQTVVWKFQSLIGWNWLRGDHWRSSPSIVWHQSKMFSLDLCKSWHFETRGWYWGAVKVSEATSEGLKPDMWVTLCDVLGSHSHWFLVSKKQIFYPHTMIVKHALCEKQMGRWQVSGDRLSSSVNWWSGPWDKDWSLH